MNSILISWMIVWTSVIAFDTLICVGTAYLVFWKGESGWWWLLAIIIMGAQWEGAKALLGIKDVVG